MIFSDRFLTVKTKDNPAQDKIKILPISSGTRVNQDMSEENLKSEKIIEEGIGSVPRIMESEQGQRSPCCCQEEIKSLKRTVKHLSVQIEKQADVFQRSQKEMIAGMKECVRNVALALLTFCNDSPTQFSETEQVSDQAVVDTGLLNNSVVITFSDVPKAPTQDNLQDEKDVAPATTIADDLPVIVSSISREAIGRTTTEVTADMNVGRENADLHAKDDDGIEAGAVFCQKFKEETDVNIEDKLGDSFYVLNENEDEANLDNEDDKNSCHGTSSTSSTKAKRKGEFQKRDHHKNVKHSTKRSKCHLCTKVFRHAHDLKRHIQSVHEGIRHKCTYCPGIFSTKRTAQRHEKRVHRIGGPPTQQCKICGIHLPNSEHSLANHMSFKHKEAFRSTIDNRKCAYCPAKYCSITSLRNHEKRVHLEGRPTQKCKLCGVYLLDTEYSLGGHMKMRHKILGEDLNSKRNTTKHF